MNEVEEIKERLNIVDIVQEYIPLQKAGTNHKARCPFHNEKSPSFTVSEQKQFYHCFGCDKGGDIFSFVQEMEGVEFPEALRLLAAKAGVTLKKQNKKEENEKSRLLDCIQLAAQFFHIALQQSQEGEKARTYIQQRGISDEMVKAFQLGYSADSWDALMNFLQKRGYTPQEMERAGLVVPSQKTGKHYDRFRGRLMFPIHNTHGLVVGFTARTLEEEYEGGKYINTPQTPLYNKSGVIYGLHLAKQYIKKMDAAVIVEGNVDVITAHQFNFRNVVATSGTALTIEQVKLLKRYSSNIILAFDSDSAGIQAAWRGMQIAVQQGMNIKVMEIGEGKDPDDMIRHDAAAFRETAIQAKPFMEYAFDVALRDADMTQVQDKKNVAAQLLPMIALFPDEIERAHYVRMLGEKVGVSADVLQNRIDQAQRNARVANQPAHVQPQQQQNQSVAIAPEQKTQMQQLAERFIALLAVDSTDIATAINRCEAKQLPEGELQDLYKSLIDHYNSESTFTSADFFQTLSESQQATWRRHEMIGEEQYAQRSTQERQMELITILESIERLYIKGRLQAVQHELAQAEMNQNEEAIQQLSEEFRQLTETLKKVG